MSITKSIKEYHKGLEQLDQTASLFHERDTERLFANLIDSLSQENDYFTRSDAPYTTDSNTKIRFDTAVYTGVGIVIYMYFNDHNPPHFHVKYNEHRAKIEIENLMLMGGHLPSRVLGLVIEWAEMHKKELSQNWYQLQKEGKFKKIEPLV